MRCRGSGTVNTNNRGGGTRDTDVYSLQQSHHRYFNSNKQNSNKNDNRKYNHNRTFSVLTSQVCSEYNNGYFEQPHYPLPSAQTQEMSLMHHERIPGARFNVCTNPVTVSSSKPLSFSMREEGNTASSGCLNTHKKDFQTPMNTVSSHTLNMHSVSNRQRKCTAGMQAGSPSVFQTVSPKFYHQQQRCCETMYSRQWEGTTGSTASASGYEDRNKNFFPMVDDSHSLATCSSGGASGFSPQYPQRDSAFYFGQHKKNVFMAKSLHQQRQTLRSNSNGYASLHGYPLYAWKTRDETRNNSGFHFRKNYSHSEAHVGRTIRGQLSEDIAVGEAAPLQLEDTKQKETDGKRGVSVKQRRTMVENERQEESKIEFKKEEGLQFDVSCSSFIPQGGGTTSSDFMHSNGTILESSARSDSQTDLCGGNNITARLPPQLAKNTGRITCCLDLDNTLVYTFTQPPLWWDPEKNSLHLEIEFWVSVVAGKSGTTKTGSEKRPCNGAADMVSNKQCVTFAQNVGLANGTKMTEDISNDGMQPQKTCVRYYVCIRPDALEFVEFCLEKFEVVFFTSGTEEYACKIFDHLDPKRAAHRLYRHHCTMCEDGLYRKDLSLLGRPVNNIILFDDRGPDVCFQPQNVLFCEPFILEEVDDAFEISTTDRELRAYMMFLNVLSGLEKDVIFKAIQMYNNELVKETHILMHEDTQEVAINTQT